MIRPSSGRLRAADAAGLVFVCGVAALYAWRYVDFTLPPTEDAAMLMRYARHLAAGHGIVWNIGEPPIDGATDFLFVLAIGLLQHGGLPLETAVLALTLGGHLATVALVYLGLRIVQHAGRWVAIATALFVAVGPGAVLAASYFGATFFACALTVAWLLGQRVALGGRHRWIDCFAFAVAAFIAALIRPEGALMAVFMAFGLALLLPAQVARRFVMSFVLVFIPLGDAYALWRWQYFGHVLPHPFLKKGGGHLYWDGLEASLKNTLRLCYPFLLAFPLAPIVRGRSTLRMLAALMLPLVGFTGIWVWLSPEANFAARFQYPLLPIAALSWYPLLAARPDERSLAATIGRSPGLRAGVAVAGMLIAAGLIQLRFLESVKVHRVREGNYDMAMLLRLHAARGYTLATTEAGLLPLYSEWRAVDTWGLNDRDVVHGRVITEAYLNERRPAVVMWHGYFSPLAPLRPEAIGLWHEMVLVLQRYVERNGYVLAAIFGRELNDTHYYWVAADLPECAEIVAGMRALTYPWPFGGAPATNFLEQLPPQSPGCAD